MPTAAQSGILGESNPDAKMMESKHGTLFVYIVALALAVRAQNFPKCVHPLAAFQAGAAGFANLVAQNHVTGRGTPVSVVKVNGVWEVSKTVKCAAAAGLKVCARSGGHALDGRSLCNGGVMIDLSSFNKVTVNSNGVATIGSAATLGEALWNVYKSGRWISAGTCPNVGIGGYLLGGGHGPYEGRLGLGCDVLQSATVVLADGRLVTASKSSFSDLFWTLCGSGGATLGIVTEFKLNAPTSAPFDRAVVFRYKWPLAQSGEVLRRYATFREFGGDLWVRFVATDRSNGFTAQGACYNVGSIAECRSRLVKSSFFQVPSKNEIFMGKARNALDVAGFFGPDGKWGNRFAPNLWQAFNNKRYTDAGKGNDNSHHSQYLDFKGSLPNTAFWQRYADYCCNKAGAIRPRSVCQVNQMGPAVREKRNNAFAHRAATVQTHFTVNKASAADREAAAAWMRNYFRAYTIGAYVNYPDSTLKADYAKAYWGSNLARLRQLKAKYDASMLFSNPQPLIPA